MVMNSEFLPKILSALNERSKYQTYIVREWEIMEASAMVKNYDFLPRFIIVPVEDYLVSIPVSEYTWQSIKRDAHDLHDNVSHLIEYCRDGNRLYRREDAFNIPAALL
jgi:hypothetical protein